MQYGLYSTSRPTETDCYVIGIMSDINTPQYVDTMPDEIQNHILNLKSKLTEASQFLWHHEKSSPSIFLYCLGPSDKYTPENYVAWVKKIALNLLNQQVTHITWVMPRLISKSADWQLTQTLLSLDFCFYTLNDYKSINVKTNTLTHIDIAIEHASEQAVQEAQILANSIALTRTLANHPANVCTPTYLADTAVKLSKTYKKIKTIVHDSKQITKLGMNTLMAVAKGSQEPPKFIEMHYNNGPKNNTPVVIVGKGITFDSGGLSIKPANAMDEMKYDMCGAASVIGTMNAVASLDLPVNVIGLIPTCENMPSGTAVKPGDIIKSLSGQYVEIINTDAEGRLILADALTYAEKFNPKWVIDIATLTGAVIVALGHEYTGLMTKDDNLAKAILEASDSTLDKTWRLPLDNAYQEAITSPIADMLNATFDRSAGSITAACFLSRFTEKYSWAHLDIAGTAWNSGKERTATGRPVSLLLELIKNVTNR